MPRCDVCAGNKLIRVATYPDVEIASGDGMAVSPFETQDWKEFPCPQCCMVPFKRVRAMKVTTSYPADEFARAQMPIERGLAARFGEYLYREGLIRFSVDGTADFGVPAPKITITAHLGVVSREDTRKARADEEVAMSPAPPLPEKVRSKIKGLSNRARRWEPPAEAIDLGEEITDEFDEPKDALGSRFAGLDLG